MELKEVGLNVGERRVGRLMKINGIKPVRTRKHKVTTDSHHRLGVATLVSTWKMLSHATRILRSERDEARFRWKDVSGHLGLSGHSSVVP